MILLIKNLIFTIVVPGTVAGYVPWLIVRGDALAAPIWLILGSALFIIGAAVYLWCVWDFATVGRGTPAPIDAPKELVIRGLYRYTRNPMYLGVLTVILGWALSFWSLKLLLYAVCVGTIFHLFIVLYEEPHLRKTFGVTYGEYCSQVRRWLPTIRRVSARGDR